MLAGTTRRTTGTVVSIPFAAARDFMAAAFRAVTLETLGTRGGFVAAVGVSFSLHACCKGSKLGIWIAMEYSTSHAYRRDGDHSLCLAN